MNSKHCWTYLVHSRMHSSPALHLESRTGITLQRQGFGWWRSHYSSVRHERRPFHTINSAVSANALIPKFHKTHEQTHTFFSSFISSIYTSISIFHLLLYIYVLYHILRIFFIYFSYKYIHMTAIYASKSTPTHTNHTWCWEWRLSLFCCFASPSPNILFCRLLVIVFTTTTLTQYHPLCVEIWSNTKFEKDMGGAEVDKKLKSRTSINF